MRKRGGPRRWKQALLRALDVSPGPRHVGSEAFALALLAWLPFVLVGLAESAWTRQVTPILLDVTAHLRLLVAVPLLHVADEALAIRCDDTMVRLDEEGFAADTPLESYWEQARRTLRSPFRLMGIRLLAFLMGQILFWHLVEEMPIAARNETTLRGATWAVYTWFSLPIFYYLLLRVLHRWLIWCKALVRIARTPLRTTAAHPDLTGGIAFLVRPSLAIAIPILAQSVVLAGAWWDEIVSFGVSVSGFLAPLVTWALFALALALGPMMVLLPTLVLTRRVGLREYGKLASDYTHGFADRWLGPHPPKSLLGTPDLQSLADLGGSFEVVRKMRILPFGLEHVGPILLAAVGPILPLAFTEFPLVEIVRALFEAILR